LNIAYGYIIELIDIIAYLHKQSVIHRDVKRIFLFFGKNVF